MDRSKRLAGMHRQRNGSSQHTAWEQRISDLGERPYTKPTRSFSVPRSSVVPEQPPRPINLDQNSSTVPPGTVLERPSTEWPGHEDSQLSGATPRKQGSLTTAPLVFNQVDDAFPWRPFYLQRRILCAFATIFAAVIISLEALLGISNRDNGLATSSLGIPNVWRYGPVAILTVVATAWSRVDFQSKLAAPWERMARGPASADETLLLDYVSMCQPVSVVRAIRNGDLAVAAVSTISLVLKLSIILSTALTTITPFSVQDPLVALETSGTLGETAVLVGDRLIVQPLAVQLVVATLVLAILLVLVPVFAVPPKGFLPMNPNTILGTATLLAHSKSILQNLRGLGAGDMPTIQNRMKAGQYRTTVEYYGSKSFDSTAFIVLSESTEDVTADGDEPYAAGKHPIALLPISRISILLVIVGIIAILENTLRLSKENAGIGDAQDDKYLYFAWASVPALVLTMVSTFLDSMDTSARVVAPYINLKGGASFSSTIGLNLTDRSTPLAIFKSFQTRNFATLLLAMAALAGSFLATVTSSLFEEMLFTNTVTSELQIQNSFTNEGGSITNNTINDGVTTAMQILQGNLPYPAFTFEDLAFPGMELSSSLPNDVGSLNASSIMTSATVPAIRARLTCRLYDQSNIVTNLTLGGSDLAGLGKINPLRITIQGEECNFGTSELTSSHLEVALGTAVPDQLLFGTDEGPAKVGCSDVYFAWGNLSFASDPPVIAISALACNETNEAVDVATTFFGTELAIDPSFPPLPIESSVRNTTALVDHDAIVLDQPSDVTSSVNRLNPTFAVLTTSRYAIPVDLLGDMSHAETVADALRFQHNIIRTQLTSATLRAPANTTNSTLADPPVDIAEGHDAVSIPANTTDSKGSRRVVQDEISTRLIQGFLGAIVFMSLVAWILMPGTDVLPRSPTSIASVAALFADSHNFFGLLPRGAQWMGKDAVKRAFADAEGFKMGYAPLRRRLGERGRGNERYMIHVLRAGGWRGGAEVGLGLQARVGKGHKAFVRGLKDS
jgi:hypothetical protein